MAKILIIDDDPAIVLLLKRMIGAAHHEIEVADNGTSGLTAAKATRFEIIITDLHMPGKLSGLDLIRQLRQHSPASHVVITSGSPLEDFLIECEQMGVQHFLNKPFEITHVRGLIASLTRQT